MRYVVGINSKRSETVTNAETTNGSVSMFIPKFFNVNKQESDAVLQIVLILASKVNFSKINRKTKSYGNFDENQWQD